MSEVEALASLASGACEIAGFPIPSGDFENIAIKNYLKALMKKQLALFKLQRENRV